MDPLKQFTNFAELFVTHFAEQSATIDPNMLALAAGVLILCAIVARRLFVVLSATLLVAIGYFLLIAPSAATPIIALGAWLGSLLVAFGGMRARRWETIQKQDLGRLSETVRNLEIAAERHLLRSINQPSRATPETNENNPSQDR
jgi:xanthosine utilization system XapX-like protein